MFNKVARRTVRIVYFFIGFLLILLALFTVVARLGLPIVAGYKSSMESRVSEYLRSPVAIGELSLRWEGAGPLLQAKDVSVLETTERKVTLDEILIDINLAKSLLRGLPIINELSLVGASLAIEANREGQIQLRGMESINNVAISDYAISDDAITRQEQSEGVDLVAWLFNARKVGLLDTQLTLIDVETDQQLILQNLNIRAENDGNMHQLRVDAELPESLGGRLEIGLDMVGSPRSLSKTDGNMYLSGEAINVRALNDLLVTSGLLPNYLPNPATFEATADAEFWVTWKDGAFVSARGPLQFGPITDSLDGEPLLDSAVANLKLSQSDESLELAITDLQTTVGDATLIMEELLLSRNSASSQLSVTGSDTPVELVVQLAVLALESEQPELAEVLSSSSSSGNLRNIELQVTGATDAPVINVSADLDAVSFVGNGPLPTMGPLSGQLLMNNSLGQLTLVAEQMPLAWPALSDELLSVDSLQSVIDIDIQDLRRVLLDADVQLTDNGINTSTRIKTTLTAGASPHLDIQSSFAADDITQIKAWLPRKQLGSAASSWINRAITAGKATDGTLLFFGHVSDFPFEQGRGAFQASVQINDGTLAYLPDWPAASDINGSLELDGLRLVGIAEDSTLDKFTVSRTQVVIDNLAAPVMDLSTTAAGNLEDTLVFGATGPLKNILEPAIGSMSGTGDAELDLKLAIALFSEPESRDTGPRANLWQPLTVNGSLFLENNDVTFGRANLVLDNATGAVGFDERGVTVRNLGGKVLGHDVRITAATEGLGDAANTRINIRGVLEANDLLAHYGDPLDQFIRGASYWNATISAPHSAERFASEGVTLDIGSDLVGSELLLSAPLNKGTASIRTFNLSTAFRGPEADQFWTARYSNELKATVRIVDESMYSLLVELGQTDLTDAAASLSQPGIRVQGRVPRLAADGWIETIAQYIDSLPTGKGEPQLIPPVSINLDTESFILGRRSLGKAIFKANTDDTYLNFVVSNQALKGNMRYPRKHWQKKTALKARIDLLDWSIIDALSERIKPIPGMAQNTGALDPRLLPPVEARISMLVKDDLRVHDLVLRAQPNPSGLDITTLGFAYDTMRLVGQGHWHLRDPQDVSRTLRGKHATQLNMVLQSDDFGTGLDEIGLAGIIDDAEGSVEMKLSWPGPLYKPEIVRLDGEIKVDMNSGSIVPVEPGAGRMVGLFAFQALPRRLNFDFKDMTGVGLAFESIAGNIIIEDGVAQVPLLQLNGPIGVVDIQGTSDLNTQQFDQQVTVLPRISAALPIIGAISGGASAGIGALVATGFLKAMGIDFDRIGLRTYRFSGDWSEPSFTPMVTDNSRRRQ